MPTNTNNLRREFHAKRCQTHKNVISHFAIEMFSLSSNHIRVCVPKKNQQRHIILLKKSTSFLCIGF